MEQKSWMLPSFGNHDIADRILAKEMLSDYEAQLDIAMEVFLAERCTTLHPTTLIPSDESMLSGRSLLSYLGTFSRAGYETRQGTKVRPVRRAGICEMYQEIYSSHFDEYGRWHGRYFLDYLQFAAEKLSHISEGGMLRDRKTAEKARRLKTDAFEAMVAVIGWHLLHELWRQQALRSTTAAHIVQLLQLMRSMEENIARLWARYRQGEVDEGVQMLRAEWETQRELIANMARDIASHPAESERQLLLRYRPLVIAELRKLHERIGSGTTPAIGTPR
ncbi:hypothetical protein [Alicyclobacillus acidocaldarius]|uniref:Uncharacterized protein n=1 Tax=Alicyclobacillus acidocaldarius (strain Tc-4-1) TaxID=1048834 RepID=F8ICN5_ALIAT|nr:hypothetical protein [Alicyclobacillus acidocaldarius]AEJ43700.1 hypothetical protein TC41_1777 [Alicyclobacillus acidocaldarius subsp. acidocaldarius Tc-4-1]